jgi:hypothetical protein
MKARGPGDMMSPTKTPHGKRYDIAATAQTIAAEDQPHKRNEALRKVPAPYQKVVNMLVENKLRQRMREARGF